MPSMDENTKQYHEDVAEFKTKISRLSAWVRRDIGIPEKLMNTHIDGGEEFISRIYEFNKRDVQKTERFLYKYFKMRCHGGVTDIFHNRSSESDDILKSCQTVFFFTLPQLTKKGYRIVFIKIAPSMSLHDFDPKAIFKRFFMMSDIRFNEEKDNRKDVFILDMDGFTRQHAVKLFSGGLIAKFIKCLHEIYPRNIHAVHLIRSKSWHRSALNIWLKVSGVSKKMTSRIRSHSMDGGTLEGLDVQLQQLGRRMQDMNDAWTQKLISYGTWFESQDVIYMSAIPKNLKLPPLKSKILEDEDSLKISSHPEVYVFQALEGSFKKLDA